MRNVLQQVLANDAVLRTAVFSLAFPRRQALWIGEEASRPVARYNGRMDRRARAIAAGILAVAAAAGIGFWYWSARKAAPPAPSGVYSPEKAAAGLGGNIFEKSQNPISDKLPETNPFGADTNPFEKEANPLKAQYKNPFE